MKRHWILALALFTAGCGGDSFRTPDEPRDEAGSEGTEVHIDPELLSIPTSELGTNRTRGIAKTIEWPGISTVEGATYGGDGVIVDRILRDDADNEYGVRVRLKNTSKNVVKASWLIRFYTREGAQIAGYEGGIGKQERWQGAVIEPFGYATVSDFARVIGAEGFRLFVKVAGGSADGSVDDASPEAKEQRRLQRQGVKP